MWLDLSKPSFYAQLWRHTVLCSAAKKAVWHTSVLFTGTANTLFLIPHISTTTAPTSIKFTYFMPSIYASLYTKFKRNQPSSIRDICSWKLPHFLYLFFFFASFYKVTLSQPKTPFLCINFFQIWHTYKALCGLSLPKTWRCLSWI